MADIRVSSESLVAGSARLTAGSQQIEGLLGELRGVVNGLGGDWTGTGSAAFADLYEEFNSSGQRLQHALTGISDLLNKAGAYYAESEANVTRAFQG
ncbi:WXG100 family type VII secretion target [Mycetocola sp. BIGb0189]|uniref:WXG100 family type VII secretion target n=1 Tax=Mycetocola sp. BIGb0189 TaxID=2940604 RepID=UPI00216908B9|nr:WXG100 family type VII secretion target [Mycetocola sp. BIGb0189]MCS4276678.1 WXG100 family type VII secretion target [Mycetocola sp. BIGb0189]